jgi:hypothetical protein
VNPKALTVTGITANDKVYDGNTTATLDTTGATLAGKVPGNALTLNTAGATGAFTDPDVGTAKTVLINGLSLSGADTGNYSFTLPTATASITPPGGLTVTGIQAQNKVYDGTNSATLILSNAVLAGVLSGDTVTLDTTNAVGVFANKNVGTGKLVTVSGLTLLGAEEAKYTLTQPTLTATITPANPVVTTWPTASAITYGQTLVASTLSAGSATPAGTFAFTTPSTAPNAGTALQSVTYTPTDTTNYDTASSTVSVTVNKTAPSVTVWPTASAITYGQTLAASTLSGGSATPAGTFAFTTPSTALNAGTALQSVTYTPTDTTNYDTASSTVSVTVNKAAPSMTTWPTASAITYGQTLAASTLSGGSATPSGTFAFTIPSTAPNAGTALQSVTYTPTDTTNYNTASSTVSVTVNKASLSMTAWPVASTITYGQTLAASTLSGGSATPAGTFAFTTPSTAPNAGTALQSVTYTPTDAANYNTASSTVSVTVNKAAPSVTAWPVASSVTYGQTLAASILSGGSATPAGTFAFTTPSTAPTAGTALQIVTYTPTDTVNYSTTSNTVSVTVNKAAPSVTAWPVAGAITYGQILAASTLSGGSASPAGSFAFTTPATAPNAGTAPQSVTYTPTDTTNYNTASNTVSVTVNPKVLTVTGIMANDKAYDGNTTAALNSSGAALVGTVSPDAVNLNTASATGTFSDPNAGTSKTVLVGGLTLTGADAGNYTLIQPTTTANITPAGLTVAGIEAQNKVYDATNSATLIVNNALLVGVLTGDTVTLDTTKAIGVFADKNVGTDKLVTVGGLTLLGPDAAKYTLTQPTTNGDITPASLTVTGITAGDKVYDRTTSATLDTSSAALDGLIGEDQVTLDASGARAVFGEAAVGTGKAATVSGLAINGPGAVNYLVTQPVAQASITAATVTPGLTVSGKAYDGGTAATITGRSLSGVIGNDDVNLGLSGTAAFADKNVGTDKLVNISDLSLSGSTAGNYVLSATTATVAADITPRTLTVSATGVSKVYDGTLVATVTLSDGRVAGDVLSDRYTSALFADKNVGTGKAVSVSGLSISGPDAANYTLANSVAGATADILARAITVTAVADSKLYDGTSTSAGVPAITAGSLATTDGAVWTQTFDSKTAGMAKTLTPSGAVADGNGGHNYTVTFLNNTSGMITAKGLTVTGITTSNKTYDGNTTATLNTTGATLVGIVSGDAVNLNTASATGAFTDPNAGTIKTVLVSSLSLSGADAGNYALTQPTTTANIAQVGSATALLSSANPSLQGSNVTFTATVTPVDPASTTPSGSVQFYTSVGALGSLVALTDGVASLSTADLPGGINTLLAAYVGDSNFLGSSNGLAQLVVVVTGRPSTPNTIGILNNADGTVTVTFAGTPDAQYVVQASDNLVVPAWENVSTNTAGTDGQWTFTESTEHHRARFYRSARP